MARRLRSGICAGAIAFAVACWLAPAAANAVTIGLPDLNPATGAGIQCAPLGSPCSLVQTNPAAAAPFDGIVTRWRVRILAGPGTAQLRIVRPPGPTFSWVTSSASQAVDAGINAFETHIPILRGDQIGLTQEDVQLLTQDAAGASLSGWGPPPADGTSPVPTGTVNDRVVGLNADVERDVDGDLLGDETQDGDDDGDGVLDGSDNCPATAGASQADGDGDGQGDLCDGDDDNDGLPDASEGALGSSPANPDSDGDGRQDGSDPCVLQAGPGGCPQRPAAAKLALSVPRRLTPRALTGGVRIRVTPDQAVALRLALVAPGRGRGTILAERSLPPATGARSVRLRPSRREAAGLRRVQVRVLAINVAGAQTELRRTIRIRR